MMAKLKSLNAGDPIPESWVRRLVRAVNRLQNVTATAPLKVSRTSAGVNIAFDAPITHLKAFALKGDLSAGGSVDARRQRNDGSGSYEDDSQFDNETIYDELYGTLTGSTGDRAACFWDGDLGKWVILGIACGE